MQEFTYTGYWWLPGHSDDPVAGSIYYSPQAGLRLELLGSFDDQLGNRAAADQARLILGLVKEAKLLTLVDCFRVRKRISSPGLESDTYVARYGFIDANLQEDDLRFSKLYAQYPYLPDWLGQTGLSEQLSRHQRGGDQVTITYRMPPDISVATPQGGVAISFGFATLGDGVRSSEVQARASFRFEPATPTDIDQCLTQLVGPVGRMLSLATDKPNAPESLLAYSPTVLFESTSVSAGTPVPLTVVYKTGETPRSSADPTIYGPQMLFTFGDLRAHFADAISAWLQSATDLDALIPLFESGLESGTTLQRQFLSLATAVETYHRHRFDAPANPVDEHQRRLDSILASCPAEHGVWLKEALRWSNELKLRRRLRRIWSLAPEVFSAIHPKRDRAITHIVDTRNYFTHWDDTLREKAATGSDLLQLVELLRAMMQVCLLTELHFDKTALPDLFRNYVRYQRVRARFS